MGSLKKCGFAHVDIFSCGYKISGQCEASTLVMLSNRKVRWKVDSCRSLIIKWKSQVQISDNLHMDKRIEEPRPWPAEANLRPFLYGWNIILIVYITGTFTINMGQKNMYRQYELPYEYGQISPYLFIYLFILYKFKNLKHTNFWQNFKMLSLI